MSTASSSLRGIPPLTPLEQVGPRGYLRYNFLIALPADYDPDDVLRVLRAGWKAIANRIPELACELVPDTTPATTPTQQQQQAGLMKLQKITGDYEPLTARDLRSPELFPDSYEELRARHFPLSAFRDALFARRDTWPAAGDRLPVAAMQANFLRGGLALQCCFVHVVGDWNSFCTWLEAWAEECRRVQGEAISHPVDVSDAIFADREKIMRASGNNPGRPEDHPELTVLPFTPTGAPPKMLSKAHRGQVFYLSPEARVALKEDASPRNATSANTTITQAQAYISTNDAVVALIWRAVMGAQHPLETLEGDPVSVCNVAIDGRLRTDPAVHPRTLGNFLTWTAATLPIRTMLDGSTNIADVALAIRRALGPGKQAAFAVVGSFPFVDK